MLSHMTLAAIRRDNLDIYKEKAMREEDKVIIQIIAEIMEVNEADMTPDLTMLELGADELDMVEITMALEHAMDAEFPDSRLLINPEKESKFTVGDVIKIASEFF